MLHDPSLLRESVPWRGTWRYWFSREAVAVEAFGAFRAFDEALRAAPGDEPWPARERWLRAFTRGLVGHSPRLGMHSVEAAERARYEALAYVRLLRCAVAILLGDDAVAVVDPFSGRPFAVLRRDGGEVMVRSAGAATSPPREVTFTRR